MEWLVVPMETVSPQISTNHRTWLFVKKTIFVCDSAQGSVTMVTGTEGMVAFLQSLKKVLDAFQIHFNEKCTVRQAISLLEDIQTFHVNAKAEMREKLNLTMKTLQGPHGCVSEEFVESIGTLLDYSYRVITHA